jgi:hypothetical protein
MTALLTRYPTAATSPAEVRQAKRKRDFHCEACGEEWDTPGHIWWVCRMYCVCGEIVEAE